MFRRGAEPPAGPPDQAQPGMDSVTAQLFGQLQPQQQQSYLSAAQAALLMPQFANTGLLQYHPYLLPTVSTTTTPLLNSILNLNPVINQALALQLAASQLGQQPIVPAALLSAASYSPLTPAASTVSATNAPVMSTVSSVRNSATLPVVSHSECMQGNASTLKPEPPSHAVSVVQNMPQQTVLEAQSTSSGDSESPPNGARNTLNSREAVEMHISKLISDNEAIVQPSPVLLRKRNSRFYAPLTREHSCPVQLTASSTVSPVAVMPGSPQRRVHLVAVPSDPKHPDSATATATLSSQPGASRAQKKPITFPCCFCSNSFHNTESLNAHQKRCAGRDTSLRAAMALKRSASPTGQNSADAANKHPLKKRLLASVTEGADISALLAAQAAAVGAVAQSPTDDRRRSLSHCRSLPVTQSVSSHRLVLDSPTSAMPVQSIRLLPNPVGPGAIRAPPPRAAVEPFSVLPPAEHRVPFTAPAPSPNRPSAPRPSHTRVCAGGLHGETQDGEVEFICVRCDLSCVSLTALKSHIAEHVQNDAELLYRAKDSHCSDAPRSPVSGLFYSYSELQLNQLSGSHPGDSQPPGLLSPQRRRPSNASNSLDQSDLRRCQSAPLSVDHHIDSGARSPAMPVDFQFRPSGQHRPMLQLDNERTACVECGKEFKSLGHLRLHMNVHFVGSQSRRGIEKAVCAFCPQTFRSRQLLQRHIATDHAGAAAPSATNPSISLAQSVASRPNHSDPRPFKCHACALAFRIHGHLAKHLRSKMHIMKLECMEEIPTGTWSRLEEAGSTISEIDTTDYEASLRSLVALSRRFYPLLVEPTRSYIDSADVGSSDEPEIVRDTPLVIKEEPSDLDVETLDEPELQQHTPVQVVLSLGSPPARGEQVPLTATTPSSSSPRLAIRADIWTPPTTSHTSAAVERLVTPVAPSTSASLPVEVSPSPAKTDPAKDSICTVCKSSFHTAEEKHLHFYTEHVHVREGLNSRCPFPRCDRVYASQQDLYNHIASHYGPNNDDSQSSVEDGRSHSDVDVDSPCDSPCDTPATSSQETPCPFCAARFSDQSGLNNHIRATHYAMRPWLCRHCDAGFTSKTLLVRHLATCAPPSGAGSA